MAKASKEEAIYVPHAQSRLCRTCEYFQGSACTKVSGNIQPDGSCAVYYEPIKKAKR